jgi:ribosomal protein S18 acetylase RimI-like enzyme
MSDVDKIPYRLTNKSEIRHLLSTDREWSLYALADLDDGVFEHCDWWALPDALALVFRGIAIHPIFVLGDAASTRKLLAALPEPTGYLNLKTHQLVASEGIYRYRQCHEMRRMFLDTFQRGSGITEPLGPQDCGDIERLYASGDGGGIAFAPFQLHTGFFRGVRRDGELVAVAGVQVASRNEGVAAVGNIFTRPVCRGQGLAQTVTSAVVMALREAGIQTIGLNVENTNAAAIRAYERVGFRAHFSYSEGIADRLPPSRSCEGGVFDVRKTTTRRTIRAPAHWS